MIDEELRTIVKVFATYFTLLPVSVGLYKFRFLQRAEKIFLVYLSYGFFTDFTSMTLRGNFLDVSWIIYNLFSLAEPFFLSLYFYTVAPVPWMKKLNVWFMILLVPLWLAFHVEVLENVRVVGKLSGGFAAGYQVIFAFLSAYFLLMMTQRKSDMIRSSLFWFVTSIFFSCFCSFFLNTFLETDYQKHVWIVISFVNIISYLMTAYAFLISKKRDDDIPEYSR
ncbi:MAG: hypothetical protein KA492_12105 [Bacteroidia bacterium]|nr:hypothetical protein [Bacteroidia bacterium]